MLDERESGTEYTVGGREAVMCGNGFLAGGAENPQSRNFAVSGLGPKCQKFENTNNGEVKRLL